MILKASKRGGAKQLARHLMNGEKNEHVSVHEVSGFASENVDEALNEIYAISQGTKCSRFMFSLSLNPPQDKDVPVQAFEDALDKIEKKLGLENQPRIIVFHEKEGRRHAHCVWSRINEEMKAIDQPFFKNRLMEISRSLYIKYGWEMPKGFSDKAQKNPLNFTRQEWQQAARTGQNPKVIKAVLQECWATSDSKKSFEHSLNERGYYLAKGDRRGFVAIDVYGEVYALPRQLGLKKKDVEKRLGKPDRLPSVDTIKKKITGQVSKLFRKYLGELSKDHQKALKPLLKTKHAMTKQHRTDRAAQKAYQENRWQKEELKRVVRIRKGFKGLWDKLTGTYWKTRKQNEHETWQAHKRDEKEREKLIHKQLTQRQKLQTHINQLHDKQEQDKKELFRNFVHLNFLEQAKGKQRSADTSHIRSADKYQDHSPDDGQDFEPEI